MTDPGGLSRELLDRLELRHRAGPLPDVLVLPSMRRGGRDLHGELDLYAVKVAREAGVAAEYLLTASERRYLSEHDAGLAMHLGLGVATNLSADGLIAVGRYVLAIVRDCISRGLVKKQQDARLVIDAQKIEVDADGFHAEGVHIDAVGVDAVRQLLVALSSPARAEQAMRALDAGGGDE